MFEFSLCSGQFSGYPLLIFIYRRFLFNKEHHWFLLYKSSIINLLLCRSKLYIVSVADPGSGMWCLFDPWIRDPGWVIFSSLWNVEKLRQVDLK
jgi:hypothetical protein